MPIERLASLALPILHRLDAETAHRLTLKALAALPRRQPPADDARLSVAAFGLEFSNPVGLAAGFDKDAEVPDAMLGFGFGFVEVGTLTPRAQEGNPRPRAFRLSQDRAVINRYGFNNGGHEAGRRRLLSRAGRSGLVGINIGANKDTADKAADYVAGVRAFADMAAYLTVNISSPNTPGLRDLQHEAALDDLLARVIAARDEAGRHPPVLLKIAPDLTLSDLDAVIAVAKARRVDGLIVANTTVSRPEGLRDAAMAGEAGGLSGRPLFDLSTAMLAQAFLRADGAFPLVGVGGIDGPQAAWRKIEAGATLVQVYTSLVFDGPALVARIKAGLVERLAREGQASLAAVVGREAGNIRAVSRG